MSKKNGCAAPSKQRKQWKKGTVEAINKRARALARTPSGRGKKEGKRHETAISCALAKATAAKLKEMNYTPISPPVQVNLSLPQPVIDKAAELSKRLLAEYEKFHSKGTRILINRPIINSNNMISFVETA